MTLQFVTLLEMLIIYNIRASRHKQNFLMEPIMQGEANTNI